MIITIDGPSASGKSTIARMLSKELGYYYICSGLLYRSLAYLLITRYGYSEKTIHSVDPKHIAQCFDSTQFSYTYDTQQGEHVFFDQQDITIQLKDSTIDKIASITSVNEYVRHCVTLIQHTIAGQHDVVIDGRDVGSVVFPHAEIKFFLTASIEVRARRWQVDQKKHGNYFSHQQAIEKIADRDQRDAERAVAPLVIPSDAIVIDNSDLDLIETFDTMLSYVYPVIGRKK